MSQRMRKRNWLFVSAMIVVMQSGDTISGEVDVVSHRGKENVVMLHESNMQIDALATRHGIDLNKDGLVTKIVLPVPEVRLVSDQGALVNNNNFADRGMTENAIISEDIVISDKSQRHREVNVKGVEMLRKMLWMTLFYTGSN